MEIYLGNTAALAAFRVPDLDEAGQVQLDDGGQVLMKVQTTVVPGNRVSKFHVVDSATMKEALLAISDPNGHWANHSGEKPAWVHVPGRPGLEMLLAEEFATVDDDGLRTPIPVGFPADTADWLGLEDAEAEAADAPAVDEAAEDVANTVAAGLPAEVALSAQTAGEPSA